MKKNKLSSLADKPYLVWSILFIIAPLLMVAYYALTDKSGAFSLASVEQIPTYITTILLSVLYGVAATVSSDKKIHPHRKHNKKNNNIFIFLRSF